MNALVSVIITSYKGSAHLARALDSVYHQTYPYVEIIVVDDNDPDTEERQKTSALMKAYISKHPDRIIKYVCHEKNLNGAVARNTGVSHAEGKYLQLLDDDDILFPEKIEVSVQELKKTEADGVLVSVAVHDGEKVVSVSGARQSVGKSEKRAEMMVVPGLLGTGSNIFVTKASYEALGGFDPSFTRMQDLEFMMRFFRTYQCAFLDRVLIIKAKNDRKVVFTDYKKQRDFKVKFWEKYKEDFDEAFTKEEYDQYFNLEYTHLFRIARMNKDKADLKEAAERVKSLRPLTKGEKRSIRFHAVYRLLHKSEALRSIVQRRKAKSGTDETLRFQLSPAEEAFIREAVKD